LILKEGLKILCGLTVYKYVYTASPTNKKKKSSTTLG